jgi:hypothetical protein
MDMPTFRGKGAALISSLGQSPRIGESRNVSAESATQLQPSVSGDETRLQRSCWVDQISWGDAAG